MRRFAKWVVGILGTLLLVTVLVLQVGFSSPLSAAMSFRKPPWGQGRCQSVDVDGEVWRSEANGLRPNSRPLEWDGVWGDIDAEGQAELSGALTEWIADPRSQFAFRQVAAVEIEAQNPPEPCLEGHTYSRPAVRGDLAFVATKYQCGFDCANGGIVALRKTGFWWFPIADLPTWIT